VASAAPSGIILMDDAAERARVPLCDCVFVVFQLTSDSKHAAADEFAHARHLRLSGGNFTTHRFCKIHDLMRFELFRLLLSGYTYSIKTKGLLN